MALPTRATTREERQAEARAADPLRDYFVWWDGITEADVSSLERALSTAQVERDMQSYLQANPLMLVQHLGGGHGRWVIPQVRLGSHHVPDFVIGDRDSMGEHWTVVELEGPQRPMFNKSGDPSQYLWHGIRQIIDWRVWLEFNRDYAVRSPDEGGLGLTDISPTTPGLVIIGRSAELGADRNAFRRALGQQLSLEIHTYDWLLERAAGRIRLRSDHR